MCCIGNFSGGVDIRLILVVKVAVYQETNIRGRYGGSEACFLLKFRSSIAYYYLLHIRSNTR